MTCLDTRRQCSLPLRSAPRTSRSERKPDSYWLLSKHSEERKNCSVTYASLCSGSDHAFLPSAVHTGPGLTVFAVIPRGPHSLAIHLVRPSSPALLAQYAPWLCRATCAAWLETFTIRPPGDSARNRLKYALAKAWAVNVGPYRLML